MTEPNATDHAGMVELSAEACHEFLASNAVGRVAFSNEGAVVIFPVNYAWVDDTIVFRSAAGTKLSSMQGIAVAFEIDGIEPKTRSGWSVIVKGIGSVVEDTGEGARLSELGLIPWAEVTSDRTWVRILPEAISGRSLR